MLLQSPPLRGWKLSPDIANRGGVSQSARSSFKLTGKLFELQVFEGTSEEQLCSPVVERPVSKAANITANSFEKPDSMLGAPRETRTRT